MAFLLWPDDPGRDGSVGLAARHPAMTRPLIERRDMNRRIRTRRRGTSRIGSCRIRGST